MSNNLLNKLHEMGYGFREWKIDKEQYLAIVAVFEHYQISFILEDFEDLFYYRDLNKDIKWVDGLPKNGMPQIRCEVRCDGYMYPYFVESLAKISKYYYFWWFELKDNSPFVSIQEAIDKNIYLNDDTVVVYQMIVINPRLNIIQPTAPRQQVPHNLHGFDIKNNKLLYLKTFQVDINYSECFCYDLLSESICDDITAVIDAVIKENSMSFGIMPIYQDISRNDVVELFDLPTVLPNIDNIPNSEMPIHII